MKLYVLNRDKIYKFMYPRLMGVIPFCKLCRIKKKTFYNHVDGRIPTPFEIVCKIAQGMNVPFNDIVDFEKTKDANQEE